MSINPPISITWDAWSAGWCPSDDCYHGRPNALFQMDNLELDKNGALSLVYGHTIASSGFPSNAHTLYSRVMGGSRKDYAALVDGKVYRNSANIISGGDASAAGFGTAFNFTLISSGTQRKKDDGSALVELGVGIPTAAPTLNATAPVQPTVIPFPMTLGFISVPLGTVLIDGDGILRLKANSDGLAVMQSYGLPSTPYNWAVFNDGGQETDNDTVSLFIGSFVASTDTLIIDFILEPINISGQYENYYHCEITTDDLKPFYPEAISYGAYFIQLPRSRFTKVGDNTRGWNQVYGYRFTYTTPVDIGLALGFDPGATIGFVGGSHAQDGVYEYAQMNVNNTGTYLAKSELGPASTVPVTANLVKSYINYQVPADPQVNEVWLFRRSVDGQGLLDQWYRTIRIVKGSPTSWPQPQLDSLGDQEALTLDITVNLDLISTAAARLTDKIIDIVGPIEGRWLYFTTNTMYPSDLNDPDLVNPSLGVKTTGSSSEVFLWARAISDAAVLVGTSVDIYLLSGTFSTLPDESVDIYYRPLSCKYPPITADVAIWNGTAYYLANDGWRSFTTGGGNPLLVAPNTDRLYRGIACYGYTPPNLKFAPGTQRFPVAIHQNKLWCFMTGTGRYEVYDFVRNYWRPGILGDCTAAFATQDGYLLGFFSSDKLIRCVEGSTTTKTIGFRLLTTMQDAGHPHRRKDPFTLTLRTNVSSITQGYTAKIIIDRGSEYTVPIPVIPLGIPAFAFAANTRFDLSKLVPPAAAYQLQLESPGTVTPTPCPDFYLTDIVIDGSLRPLLLSSYRHLATNLGTPNKKRLRVWPIVIETANRRVRFDLNMDGQEVAVANPIINTPLSSELFDSGGFTERIYITTDLFGVDYGFTLTSIDTDDRGNPIGFELHDAMAPDVVQVLPIARRFDQLGPTELFAYGKIKKFELRVMPFGGLVNTTSIIPWKIYFNDNSTQDGSLTVANSVEASYYIGTRKGVAGQIVRLELGPTDFDFHRFYIRALVMRSGNATDDQWVNVVAEGH